jgi:hypothetical protein
MCQGERAQRTGDGSAPTPMHNRFDQLGKTIGLEALAASGRTVAHDEIAPDAHHADLRHEPDPAREAERARLGLLGRMGSVLCLLEVYSGAPGEDEALACVGKLIAFRQRRRRDAKKKGAESFVRPFVWVITARRPTGVLEALDPVRPRGWPRGVYFSRGVLRGVGRVRLTGLDGAGGLLRVGIVVASELPRRRSTILVRLMAGGPLLPGALADLGALPNDALEHVVASPILLRLWHALAGLTRRTTEEQEFIVSWANIVEKLREEGRKEGVQQGRQEGQARARATLRRVLAARQLAPSRRDEARIDGCDDLGTLDRWIEQAVTARTVEEALRSSLAPARRRRVARTS